MNKWSFNPQEGDNAVSNGDEPVFYVDDLNGEVIAKIVEIQNADPDGDFVSKIDEYLQGEEKCSPDEREFVLEQVGTYLQLSKASEEEVNNAIPKQPEKQGPAEGETSDPGATGKKEETAKPQSPNPNPAADTAPQKNTRRTTQTARTTTATARTSAKVESTEDLIKALQEKIELIKLLDKAEVIEIPSGLGKTAREILTDFQRDQQAMIATYMDRVKTM